MQEVNAKTDSNGRREKISPRNLVETMISFNEILMKDQGENNQINVFIFHSLVDME